MISARRNCNLHSLDFMHMLTPRLEFRLPQWSPHFSSDYHPNWLSTGGFWYYFLIILNTIWTANISIGNHTTSSSIWNLFAWMSFSKSIKTQCMSPIGRMQFKRTNANKFQIEWEKLHDRFLIIYLKKLLAWLCLKALDTSSWQHLIGSYIFLLSISQSQFSIL